MASYGRTFLLFVALTGLFVGAGWILGGLFAGNPLTGMLVFLAIAAAFNLFTFFLSDKFVLWAYRARIVSAEEAPRLHRIVRALSDRAGLPMPRIAIIPDPSPNAFATGRSPQRAVVAATEGILRALDDDELAGVMAHELAHVKNRDILTMSLAATVAGAITFAARSAFWGMLFGGGDRDRGGILAVVLLMVLAPIAALLVQLAISRSREYAADATGARIHGSPLALARALKKLQYWSQRVPMESARPETAHMMIVAPFSGGGVAGLFTTHPPMEERIRRLEALAYAI